MNQGDRVFDFGVRHYKMDINKCYSIFGISFYLALAIEPKHNEMACLQTNFADNLEVDFSGVTVIGYKYYDQFDIS